jgi:hypothetical protein
MTRVSVQILDGHVRVSRIDSAIALHYVYDMTFAEVRAAAEILREHLAGLVPPELTPTVSRCLHDSRVPTSAGSFCADCGAEL